MSLHAEDDNHQRTIVIDKQAAKQCTQRKLRIYRVNTHIGPQIDKYHHQFNHPITNSLGVKFSHQIGWSSS